MRFHSSYIIALSVFALAGCEKNALVRNESIKFDVSVHGFSTRGTVVNDNENGDGSDIALASTLSPFRTAAYDGTNPVFTTPGLDPANVETVSYDGVWTMPNTYYWPQNTVLTFFAYANLPASGSSVAITSDGQTLTHTMVPAVADQKDILLGCYTGNGSGIGSAQIRFLHPLTSVSFKVGDIGDEIITSITLNGLAASGMVTMGADGVIGDWQDVDDYTATSSQSNDAGLTVDATTKIIGEPFILIPQDLETNSVTLAVTYKSGLSFETTIESGEWQAQKTNCYTLGYGDNYVFEVSEDLHTFRNTTEQGTATIDITSEIIVNDESLGEREWNIKSYQVGTSDPVIVNGTSFTAGGLTVKTASGNKLNLTAAARTSEESPGSHDYWLNKNPVREYNLDWSPEDWSSTKATVLNPIDLSSFNFRTETTGNPMTTANCYIIRHAGTYKLPLVYGNAIVNGAFNVQSYYPNCKGDIEDGDDATKNHRLVRFQNHIEHDLSLPENSNLGITSPFIEYNTTDGREKSETNSYLAPAAGTDGYQIVWQDKADIITINGLSKEDVTVRNASGDSETFNISYLTFTIPQSAICQNNAIIAVKDADGNIMWSWHIWTTNDPSLRSGPIAVWNRSTPSVEYDFFPLYNLGWMEPNHYKALPDVRIILQQENSGNEIEITVSQPESSAAGNGCYYQFGRKDPLPTKDVTGFTREDPEGTTLSGSIRNPGRYFNNTSHWHWLTDGLIYNLWTGKKSNYGMFDQEDDIIKTVYDPSPAGYKMPASNAFSGFATLKPFYEFTDDKNAFNVCGDFAVGWYFYTKPDKTGDLIFFPAAGQRTNGVGVVDRVGGEGDYWSAFHAPGGWSSGGHHIHFWPNSIALKLGDMCTFGYSVRPVSE